eukprot:TRINITY_DN38078_c0_g1_i1.p1 TRINITY_DN38078_c0_g1~~TRINITY_DN38078_c0_g1_i1.p1  ORF type:complete len:322 (-),score=117.07 TRINITY_DN38078_c0_g1_i1:334-1299(-)
MSCPLLAYLDLSMNHIQLLGSFDPLQELQTFKLAGNQVEVLEGLHGLRKLQHLDASHNKLHDANQIVFLPELTELNLSENALCDMGAVQQALAGLPKLMSLELQGNPLRESRAYHMLLLELPLLERLDGILASPLLREQLERVKGKTDVADLISETRSRYFSRLQDKRLARNAQLNKLRMLEQEAEDAFLRFERQLNDEQESCIAALRSLVARGRGGKDEPLTAAELEAVKVELLGMEREREKARVQSQKMQEEQEMRDAMKLAGMKSKHEKLLELSKADPAKYHALKRQQMERDADAEVIDAERRQTEINQALRNANMTR